MNKIKTLFVALAALASTTAFAQTVVPSPSTVVIEPGGTADVTFAVENDTETKAALVEFFLYLPEGITVAYDLDEEDYIYEKVSTMLVKSHSVTVSKRADGSFYVLVKNESGKEFKGTSGDYLTLTLAADASFSGSAEATMTDIHLVKLDASKFQSSTENKFTIGDPSTVGIRGIYAEGEDAPLYNTAGQRVQKAHKGLYIQNGKKVVKK